VKSLLRVIAVISSICLMCSCDKPESANSEHFSNRYVYRNPAIPENFVIVDEDARTVRVNDVADAAFVCPAKDEYQCFVSEAIEYYVPRRLGSAKTWKGRHATYSIEQPNPKGLLGIEGNWLRISAKSQDSQLYFLTSEQRGLVAFGAISESDDHVGVFVLESRCGFGAPASCSERKKGASQD